MRRLAAVLALPAALAACANQNPLEVTVSRCPALAVAGHTGTLTRFAGGERDVDDVAFNAIITDLKIDCRQGESVAGRVTFNLVATRGPALASPALASQDITLPYFVAILRDNNQVVTKKVFETTLRFDPGQERAGTREVIVHRLPDITRARRYDYELLVGFQLSPDELAYNVLR